MINELLNIPIINWSVKNWVTYFLFIMVFSYIFGFLGAFIKDIFKFLKEKLL